MKLGPIKQILGRDSRGVTVNGWQLRSNGIEPMICQKEEDCLLTCGRDLPHLAHLFSELKDGSLSQSCVLGH
ncbi:hypothetical protein HanPI659440_Chr04g0159491 [Helianthus annuus]|nr:hypothetical protein HanPI659440_Chr04g0159491 [Helianthus annuus]